MKVTKSFEMTISGKYQSYKLGTSMEMDLPESARAAGGGQYVTCSDSKDEAELFLSVVNSTMADIDQLQTTDPNFGLVYQARQEELDKFKIYLANQKKLHGG
jgi:hypothetical protein